MTDVELSVWMWNGGLYHKYVRMDEYLAKLSMEELYDFYQLVALSEGVLDE